MEFENILSSEQCIFRYRSVNDDNLSALEESELYFSTPKKFNDPYDNLIYANLEKIWGNVYDNLQFGMDEYLKKLKKENPMAGIVGDMFWKGSKKDEIVAGFLEHVATVVDFVKNSVRENTKVICFSEVYDSMLMWSHYADNHKGFLLAYGKNSFSKAERFSIDGLRINNGIRLEEVDYVTEQLDLSEEIENYVRYEMMPTMGDVERKDGSIGRIKLRKFMSQKAKEWEYEREWRLIPRTIDLQEKSPLGYIKCEPVAVILGTNCSADDSKKITAITKKRKIPIFRMFLDEFSPAFKIHVGDNEEM